MIKRLFLVLGFLFGLAAPAAAQSGCQYIAYGATLTAAQWNACFAAKNDNLGYTPLNKAGDSMTGRLGLAPSTAGYPSLNMPYGVAPSVPSNGDFWMTASGLFYYANGIVVGPSNTPTFTGPTAPSVPVLYSFWNNTSGSTIPYSIYDGSQWVNIGTLNPSTHAWSPSGGIASGTSGGIPYFSSATTLASSGLLAANQLVLGGGAGTAPASLGTVGSNGQLLLGASSANPTWQTMSQDCSIAASGVITCTKTNNVAFAASATTDATNAANIASGNLAVARIATALTTPGAIGGTTPGTGKFSSLQATNIASGTQCVQADGSGNLTGTGVGCGGVTRGSGIIGLAASSSVTGTVTKMAMDTLGYDTMGICVITGGTAGTCTPTVAGHYKVTCAAYVAMTTGPTAGQPKIRLDVWKNGADLAVGGVTIQEADATSISGAVGNAGVSSSFAMNGTTDTFSCAAASGGTTVIYDGVIANALQYEYLGP